DADRGQSLIILGVVQLHIGWLTKLPFLSVIGVNAPGRRRAAAAGSSATPSTAPRPRSPRPVCRQLHRQDDATRGAGRIIAITDEIIACSWRARCADRPRPGWCGACPACR